MKNSPVIPYILLTLCALFWAGSSVVGRHVAGEIPPLALNFWRWLFAFLIVLTWTSGELWRHRQLVLQKWKYISFLALSSAIGFGALHYVALQYTTAINGALFQGLMSICILITALIILGDRFGLREGIGVVLGFTGVAVIVTRGDVNVLFGLTFNIGDIILFPSDDVVFGLRGVLAARAGRAELQRADGGNVRIRGALHAAAVAGRAIRFRPVRADEPHRRVVDRVHDAGAVGAGTNILGLFGIQGGTGHRRVFHILGTSVRCSAGDVTARRTVLHVPCCRDRADLHRHLARHAQAGVA